MTETRQRNERLADAMARAGLSSVEVAAAAQVDPRTVDRLVADWSRVPRAHSRHAIANAVDVPVGVLWPGASNGSQVTDELLSVYPSRAAVPTGLVMSMLTRASQQIDILALAGVWLWDAVASFGVTLSARAHAGATVRLCLGDPDGAAVRTRGAEECIAELLAARCRLAATYAENALVDFPGALRLHDTTLYASILRFDDELLVNWHLYGAPAADSPVLHLRRMNRSGLTESILDSFERVWTTAHLPVR